MDWLVDHTGMIYVLLGIVAATCVVAWRFNQRVKYLGLAAGFLVLIALVWLTRGFISTDRTQLEKNVQAMARAVENGRVDELFQYVSRDFRYKEMTREMLQEKARLAVADHQVRQIKITKFEVDEVSRSKKLAKTSFRVSAWGAGSDQPYLFGTQADFVLESDQWKLITIRFYNPLVDQNTEIELPFRR